MHETDCVRDQIAQVGRVGDSLKSGALASDADEDFFAGGVRILDEAGSARRSNDVGCGVNRAVLPG
jgi:hypothetical protein